MKALLLHEIKSKVEPLDSLHRDQVLMIDGMNYVQQSKVYNKTFSQFAMDLLRILAPEKS